MRVGSWQLVVGSLILFITFSLSALELKVGEFDGESWADVPQISVQVEGYEKALTVQSATKGNKLFIRVRIPQSEPSFKHRPWVLENEKFVVGKQEEDSLALRFSQKDSKIQDLWFWGANRTQWGTADDGFIQGGQYAPDAGKGPWKLNLRRETLHQNRNRYLKQKAMGSRSDVKVISIHKDGEWEIIFSRSLKSEHQDDLSLMSPFTLSISKAIQSAHFKEVKMSFHEVEN